MRAMAIGAGRGVLSLGDGLAVDAVDVLLDWMRDGHFVAREETGVAVAFGAGGSDLLFGDERSGFSRRADVVNGAVTGGARGRVGVAGFCSAAVSAGGKIGNFLLVTRRAFVWS